MSERHWQDGATLLLGLWIFASPWIFGDTLAAQAPGQVWTGAWNLWMAGVAILCVAGMALRAFRVWKEWTNLGFGVWLLASPWILGFGTSTTVAWDVTVVGALILVLAGWTLATHGGGTMEELAPNDAEGGAVEPVVLGHDKGRVRRSPPSEVVLRRKSGMNQARRASASDSVGQSE